jgi:hypothetical protein
MSMLWLLSQLINWQIGMSFATDLLLKRLEIVVYYTLSSTYKIITFKEVESLDYLLVVKSSARSLKLENMIEVKKRRSATSARSLHCRAVKLWNDLPSNLRNQNCPYVEFKYRVAQILIDRWYKTM